MKKLTKVVSALLFVLAVGITSTAKAQCKYWVDYRSQYNGQPMTCWLKSPNGVKCYDAQPGKSYNRVDCSDDENYRQLPPQPSRERPDFNNGQFRPRYVPRERAVEEPTYQTQTRNSRHYDVYVEPGGYYRRPGVGGSYSNDRERIRVETNRDTYHPQIYFDSNNGFHYRYDGNYRRYYNW